MERDINIDLIDSKGRALLEYINDNIITRKGRELEVVGSDFKLDLSGKSSINTITKVYDIIYRSIPFPLNILDCDIFHKVIGKILVSKLKDGIIDDVYIYKGLNVVIKDTILNLRGKSWTVADKTDLSSRQGLNLDVHIDEAAYEYFVWLLDIIGKVNLDNLESMFYKKYFNNLYNVVGYDMDEMHSVLLNIILFNVNILDKLDYLGNGEFFNLNIYTKEMVELYKVGYKRIDNDIMLVYRDGELKKIVKQVPVYNYRLYDNNDIEDVENKYIYNNLFRLLEYKRVHDADDISEEFSAFSGLRCNDKIMYNIDGRLYIENQTTKKVKLLGNGLEILGYVVNEFGIYIYLKDYVGLVGNHHKGKVYSINLLESDVTLTYKGLIYSNKQD